jgi:hypothetical protein
MKEGGNQMMTIKKFVLFGIFTAVLLAFSAPVGYAGSGGSSGEPGANCPNNEVLDFQYVPPPYIGTINVAWAGGVMYTFGSVEQVGTDCSGDIGVFDALPFGSPISQADFNSLKQNDIRGQCLVQHIAFFDCIEQGFLEIVGAHNVRHISATQLTAEVVMMPVIVRP